MPRARAGAWEPPADGAALYRKETSYMLRLNTFLVAVVAATTVTGCVTVTTDDGEVITKGDKFSASRLRTLDDEAKRYPKRHDLQYEIAQIHFQQGDYHASASALHRAIDLAPDVSRYHYDLGRVYLRSAEFNKAETAFRDATRLSGDRYTGPRAALAYVLAMEKKFDEARRTFEECIRLEPQNVEYYYFLGSIWDMQGNTEEAARYYREYVERGGLTYQRKALFLLDKLGVKIDPASIASGAPETLDDGLEPPAGEFDPGPVGPVRPVGPVSQVEPSVSAAER